MKKDWLWDRKISLSGAKKILRDFQDKKFILLASLLLTRKNDPEEVFREYIDPIMFCKSWPKIKKNMRKNKWSDKRIIFWQAVYEKLMEKYRGEGIRFREKKEIAIEEISRKTGDQIRRIRREQGLSQKELAKKMGVSQQQISRIEKGKENVSLTTLTGIMKALNKTVNITFG
ncbi:MAG: helix-turn-helix domain-containing protein [Candidatus Omnitrophica bacterium]|nr:helix-turn-helix domain-containing protein [Candidatus Omnitrophota bacterium]